MARRRQKERGGETNSSEGDVPSREEENVSGRRDGGRLAGLSRGTLEKDGKILRYTESQGS